MEMPWYAFVIMTISVLVFAKVMYNNYRDNIILPWMRELKEREKVLDFE